MISLHQRRTHPEFQDGCYACRISSVLFSGSDSVKKVEKKERLLAKDRDAYKSLRKQGYQPQHVGGSAKLEANATNRHQIEHPRLWASLDKEGRAHIDEAASAAASIPDGMSVAPDAP